MLNDLLYEDISRRYFKMEGARKHENILYT